jgi:hypothetical protein
VGIGKEKTPKYNLLIDSGLPTKTFYLLLGGKANFNCRILAAAK